MAGLAFEHAATLIGIDGRAAAMGADRGAVSIFPSQQSILWAASSDKSQRSASDRVRAAADIRKCCATGAIQKNGHAIFLRYSEADVYFKQLISLLGAFAP